MRCERAWTNNCAEKRAGNGKVESCQIDTIPPGKGKRCCGRKENVHHWFLCKPALGGQRPSTATPIRASFCHRTGACRNLSQPLFRVSRNQGVTHTTLQAKSCAKGMLPLACRLGQVLQNALHFEVATGDPHPFGNPRETPINCAARPRPVR